MIRLLLGWLLWRAMAGVLRAAFGTPADPVGNTVITVAYAVANLLNPIRWLRQLTGNADPPGSNYTIRSTSTSLTEWSLVTTDMIANNAIVATKILNGHITPEKLFDANTPADNDVLTFNGTSGGFEWQDIGALVDTTIPDNTVSPAKLSAIAKPVIGHIAMYAGDSQPDVTPYGWLFCNGQAISRSTYSALFAIVGTDYGAGDGSTTFNLPDMQNRVPIGAGDDYTVAQQWGSNTSSVPHDHSVSGHDHSFSGTTGNNNAAGQRGSTGSSTADDPHQHGFSGTTSSAGSGTTGNSSPSVDIRQPSLGVQFMIYAGVAS